jgi:hypothetical protein
MAGGDLLAHPLPHACHVRGLLLADHHVRGDRSAPGRELGQRGDVDIAEDGHGDRARDRGGRHDEDMRP